MPMYAENFVEELKDRVDLYDLISPYVQLKKSGAKWVGLSPFNQEKTPSFYQPNLSNHIPSFPCLRLSLASILIYWIDPQLAFYNDYLCTITVDYEHIHMFPHQLL